MRLKTISLALAAILLSGLVQAQEVQRLDQIVAVVEENVILESELQTALTPIKSRIESENIAAPPEDVLRRQVLDRLVNKEIQLQRAEMTGIRISDAEVDRAIVGLAQQNGVSPQQLRERVEADGTEFADFRRELREQLIIQDLHRRVAASEVNVTESEIDIALASEDASEQGEVKLAHILIALPNNPTPEQLEGAQERIREIESQLANGMPFDRAAITYSDGQNALEGGELGWRPSDQVPRAFAGSINDLEVGDHSEPLRSQSGIHIVKMLDRRDESVRMVAQRRARHLLIATDELTSDSAALEMARNARERIVEDGEEFAEVARELSDDTTTAELGGDMDWFSRGVYGSRVDEVLDTLEQGEVSQPFRTDTGWHLVKLEDTREEDMTEEYRRQRARNGIRQRKAEETVNRWVRQQRAEAFVDIRLES